MKQVIFFPSGTRELPSSHLRIYEVAAELEKRQLAVPIIVNPNLEDEHKTVYLETAPEGSIVYIQKIAQSFHKAESFQPYRDRFTFVYDVDDYHEGRDSQLMDFVDLVVSGSHYISHFAVTYNPYVYTLCSITDTEIYRFAERSNKDPEAPVQIVWSEWYANAYIEDMFPLKSVMQELYEEFGIRFVLQGLRENRHVVKDDYKNKIIEFIRMFPFAIVQKYMTLDQYLDIGVRTLFESDIGILPFKEDRVGKAGQNARSFMSCGLATVASPHNEHDYIIDHGNTGFLASTSDEWYTYLRELIIDRSKRLVMGIAASEHIRATYSREVYMNSIVQILQL